jgi:pentatricopeptide repeat protein
MSEPDIEKNLRLADDLWKSGKLHEAEEMFREMRNKDPKCWQVYFFLGDLLFELQRSANTASMFRTVLELSKHLDIPEESLDITKEGIDLAVRIGWPEPTHAIQKQLPAVHDKLEADVEKRDKKAIDLVTGPLRGELNRVRESMGRYLFVLDPEDYLRE